MSNKRMWTGCLIAAGVVLGGCEKTADVSKETEDLRKAQQESPQVANDLQQQLEEKKGEVAKLEEQLALARQGVTDDVIKEQNELKHAMKDQEQKVQQEINEAKGAAREHTNEAANAAKQLEQVEAAERVKAEVKTNTTVVPSQTKTEVRTQEQNVPVENSKLIERTTERTGEPRSAGEAMGKDDGR